MNNGSRSSVAATRRRIARRRLASATDLARYPGSRLVGSYFDKGERIRASARREEARDESLARESSEFGHERDR